MESPSEMFPKAPQSAVRPHIISLWLRKADEAPLLLTPSLSPHSLKVDSNYAHQTVQS